MEWNICHDVTRRGYAPEQVAAGIERHMLDSSAHIWFQREYPDIMLRFYRPPGYDPEKPSRRWVRITLERSLPRLGRMLLSAYENQPIVLSLEAVRRAICWTSRAGSAQSGLRSSSGLSGSRSARMLSSSALRWSACSGQGWAELPPGVIPAYHRVLSGTYARAGHAKRRAHLCLNCGWLPPS